MKSDMHTLSAADRHVVKPVYILLLLLMGLTGFAQMPIFKRYYIADIPGLGWLAEYYVTHTIHYLGAIALIVLIVYGASIYAFVYRRQYRLTGLARIRVVLLAAIVITGVFRVLKNLPDVVFSPGFTMFVDIAHLGFMMFYLAAAVAALISRCGWLSGK